MEHGLHDVHNIMPSATHHLTDFSNETASSPWPPRCNCTHTHVYGVLCMVGSASMGSWLSITWVGKYHDSCCSSYCTAITTCKGHACFRVSILRGVAVPAKAAAPSRTQSQPQENLARGLSGLLNRLRHKSGRAADPSSTAWGQARRTG